MSMLTCTEVIENTMGTANDTITLDETDRHRRRITLDSDGGIRFLLDLPQARLLADGDLLVLSDGRRIAVRSQEEALYEVRANDTHELLRLAWHIGNRHLPTEIQDGCLRIRADTVIKSMLEGLGADVRKISAGFHPESGAYGDAKGHHHG